MKVKCERDKLSHAFQLAAAVAPSRSPKPILQNVKLDVAADAATIMGTDLEVGIRIETLGFEVAAPGSVILPTGRFGAILRESSDEKLDLETDGRRILVRGERSQFQLPSEDPDEFPLVAVFKAEAYHELPARFFREIIRRTAFATDPESSRYALGGVYVELTEDRIVAVGTDGRRLAKQEGPAQSFGGHQTGDQSTIIPTRAMQLLERVLADGEENVQLAVSESDVLVRSGRATVYSRLLEGRYPRWRDVFPRHTEAQRLELTVGPFYAAVRQAAIVTSEQRRGVEFTFGDGKVVLSGHGAEYGESLVELPIAYDGAAQSVSLDPRYLAEFLRVLDAETTFIFELREPHTAVVCTTDDGYAYVIMPLSRDSRP
jgi:DNA polymerase III subunit beta